ncbi:helix-turn-helix domain-containing protein, partial [Myceligenerans pegani]
AGVRRIGAPAPQAPAPVRPPTGAIPVATVAAQAAPAERRRPAARDHRRTEVRSAAPTGRTEDSERRAAGSRRNAPPAERQPGARLDEVTVNRIIDLFAQGVTVKSIAKQLKVGESTVRKHLKNFEATGSIPVVRT